MMRAWARIRVRERTIHHFAGMMRQSDLMADDNLLQDLVSLPQAAAVLGLHRATVNEMVNSGRLTGHRLGPHWYVRRSELDVFSRSYRRPRTSPRRRLSGPAAFHWTNELLRWLLLWESATSEELSRVIDLHVGNVRKYLALAELDGLIKRDDYGYWSLTQAGHERAERLPRAGEAVAS